MYPLIGVSYSQTCQFWAKPGLATVVYTAGKQKVLKAVSVCLLREKKNPEISNDWNFSHHILLSWAQINK